MAFENYVADPFHAYTGLIVAIAMVIGSGITVSFMLMCMSSKGLNFKIGCALVGLVLSIVGGVTAVHMDGISNGVKAQNRVVAENNLKAKYDIESVLWSKYGTYPESYDLTTIYIQDKNSNILKYQYKINNETKEPYLLNDSDSTTVKANDLLLNK